MGSTRLLAATSPVAWADRAGYAQIVFALRARRQFPPNAPTRETRSREAASHSLLTRLRASSGGCDKRAEFGDVPGAVAVWVWRRVGGRSPRAEDLSTGGRE